MAATKSVTIASFNMLFEGHYRRYCELPPVPEVERAARFAALFDAHLEPCDILCLQECSLPAGPYGRHHVLRASDRLKETSAVVYDPSRFDITAAPRITWFTDPRSHRPLTKAALTVDVRDRITSCALSVTSAHLPWSSSAAGQAYTLAELAHTAGTAGTQADSPDIARVVCGDFNLEDTSAVAQFFPDAQWTDVSAGVSATVASARGTYDKIDFVLVAGGAKPGVEPCRVVPSSPKELIKHVPVGDDATPGSFCSDHAALIAQLELLW